MHDFSRFAEAIAIGLGIPCVPLTADEARDHFDWFFGFVGMDQTTSSDRKRAQFRVDSFQARPSVQLYGNGLFLGVTNWFWKR